MENARDSPLAGLRTYSLRQNTKFPFSSRRRAKWRHPSRRRHHRCHRRARRRNGRASRRPRSRKRPRTCRAARRSPRRAAAATKRIRRVWGPQSPPRQPQRHLLAHERPGSIEAHHFGDAVCAVRQHPFDAVGVVEHHGVHGLPFVHNRRRPPERRCLQYSSDTPARRSSRCVSMSSLASRRSGSSSVRCAGSLTFMPRLPLVCLHMPDRREISRRERQSTGPFVSL